MKYSAPDKTHSGDHPIKSQQTCTEAGRYSPEMTLMKGAKINAAGRGGGHSVMGRG